MYALTYTSKARKDCTDQEIKDILDKSNLNNQKLDITGCLIYHKKTFIQILEGPKNEIYRLIKKLERDIRHSEITVLWEENCESRTFSNWSMGFLDPLHKFDKKHIENFENKVSQLSRLYQGDNATVRMFWHEVETMICGKERIVFGKLKYGG